MLGARIVSAQDLPPCTESLIDLPEYQDDGDGIEQDVDIDKDGDGLIEICDLEGLYEMRYVLDGSGYSTSPTTTPIRTGCSPTCTGFELTRNLNFTDDASYRTTANRVIYTVGNGWEPVGISSNPFNAEFEGNGHAIFNLMIRGNSNFIGLFGVIGAMANIANIGLLNVRIVENNWIGGLVGDNSGTITNSYTMGSVEGNTLVGGLVGTNNGFITSSYATGSVSGIARVGGLVGFSEMGSITNSYATGPILGGGANVGGLVGWNFFGSITNSYATGDVEGTSRVGGLVGWNYGGSITNSYAANSVLGTDRVGGLVGFNSDGSITNSYATGPETLVGSISGSPMITNSSATTELQLREPIAARGIYSGWSSAVWDFGTAEDLPTLRDPQRIEGIQIHVKVFLEGLLQ